MKRIAASLTSRLKQSKQKIVELAEYKELTESLVPTFQQLQRADFPIYRERELQYTIYTEAQKILLLLIEKLSGFPEFIEHNRIIEKAEMKYMTSWLSPIQRNFFNCWASFDVKAGVDKESYSSCIIELKDLLGLSGYLYYLCNLMQQTRLGIYKVLDSVDGKAILEELFTKKRYQCYMPDRSLIVIGELWLTRLFPPLDTRFNCYIVFTTPYTLKSSYQEWETFFEKTIKGIKGSVDSRRNYELFMKNGLGAYYWLEFISHSYHRDSDINLSGIPSTEKTSGPYFFSNQMAI